MSKIIVRSSKYYCTIEEAFDYVSNVDNRPKWQRPLDTVNRVTPAPDHAGTYWTEDFKMLGMTHKAKMSYTKFERPKIFVEKADLPLCTGKINMVFEEESNGGCRLVVESTIKWKGIFKLFTPLLEYSFKRMVTQDLQDIGEILNHRSI